MYRLRLFFFSLVSTGDKSCIKLCLNVSNFRFNLPQYRKYVFIQLPHFICDNMSKKINILLSALGPNFKHLNYIALSINKIYIKKKSQKHKSPLHTSNLIIYDKIQPCVYDGGKRVPFRIRFWHCHLKFNLVSLFLKVES